jgi:hypothetical protein
MARRFLMLAAVAMLVVGVASDSFAKSGGELWLETMHGVNPGERHLYNDPSARHLNGVANQARQDTFWWGGVGVDGVAEAGGIWDFEDGTLQGWTSKDLTDVPPRFRHVTADSCAAHGDPLCGVMTSGGSVGSMWCGWHEDEASEFCWPGGMGYGNGEGQNASKQFIYGGSGNVTVSFDYFTDSETQWDFTYCYVIDNFGNKSAPVNPSAWGNEDGNGYSGSEEEGAATGTPSNPAQDQIVLQTIDLPDSVGDPFEFVFNFDSDPLVSDALDHLGQPLDSHWGPFGFDNFRAVGVDLDDTSDFEPTGTPGEEYDDWIPFQDLPIGAFMKVAALVDIDPIAIPCACPLTDHPNDFVMVASDTSALPANFPHPKKQFEELNSATVVLTGVASTDRFFQYSVYEDTPTNNGAGYRFVTHYYPWTCPEDAGVGWTIEPAGEGGYRFANTARCVTFIENQSTYLPATVDSIRVVFRQVSDCDDFGWTDVCTGPEQTNQTPYWDDIRFGVSQTVNAPQLSPDIIYQDCYPTENTLVANATALMSSYYDNNRTDEDLTNANMGDSTVVLAGTQPNSEIYLNYRVYPGPETSLADPFWSTCGNPLEPNWAKARCDTAETRSGLANGRYATYQIEGSCGYQPPETVDIGTGGLVHNPANKILPDDLFTPGTTIEYFFTSNFTGSSDQDVMPDTTGEFFWELEVLPGYFEVGGNIMTAATLYVDAFNFGAQVPLEQEGFTPYFGTTIDDNGRVHENWDRYDYLAASNNTPAPFARESNGNNGCTRYQSMVYRTIMYNTGSSQFEGLRDGDAALLQNFLINDDFNRYDFQKGLWLSGNGMPTILDREGRPQSNNLLVNFCGATVAADGLPINDPGVFGDSSLCVRLDATTDRDFPTSAASYGSVRGNGCPTLREFRLVDLIGAVGTVGNLEYTNQDDGEIPMRYAASSNDQFAPGNAANYGVVLEAFSSHYIRTTSDGWTGDDCGTDSSAIGTRLSDVLNWVGAAGAIDPSPVIVSTQDPLGPTPARTMLMQNTPNPFNPRTTVRYQLAGKAHVSLKVFDVSGRVVRTLVDQVQSPNVYDITWDGTTDNGTNVASGVYWARMSTSRGFTGSTKMVVLK